VTETTFQIVRSAGFALAIVLALTIQRLAPHARLQGSWRVSAGLWLVNLLATGVACGACMCTASAWAASHGVGLLNVASAGPWLAIPATVIGLDLVSYGWHRANHRIPLLWRFHRVHHSDVTFTVATALRFHPGELLASLPLRLAAVVALGAPVAAVLVFEIVFTFANFVEHGDIDCPASIERPVQALLITPALHRRHHAADWTQLDSNFGTVLSVWDRFFRTYGDAASTTAVQTGLPGHSRALGFGDTMLLPFRGARSLVA